MAATPSSTIAAYTPSTPRHGASFDTSLVHPARRQTRHTTRGKRLDNAPPPPVESHSEQSGSSVKKKVQTRRTVVKVQSPQSPPSSTHNTPRKKVRAKSVEMSINTMDLDESSPRAASLDPFHDPTLQGSLLPPTTSIGPNMLPTPVKTPRKKPTQQQAALKAGGRILFPDRAEDPMPTMRRSRKGKKQGGFSLYGSMEDETAGLEEDGIPIYTDSKDKVPEMDRSEDNPFLDKPEESAALPEPVKRKTRKNHKPSFGLDGSKEIEEAFKRDEGMVYVFRGKKIYRKFPAEETDPEEDEANDEDRGGLESSPHPRPLRRANIKPRLLFPPNTAKRTRRTKSDIEDEEAPTDIDDTPQPTEDTTTDQEPQKVRTPVKESFVPSTPPDTARATRSAKKKPVVAPIGADSSSPGPETTPPPERRGKKVSPFDGWARTKAGVSVTAAALPSKGKKRGAEAMHDEDEKETDKATSKRVRA